METTEETLWRWRYDVNAFVRECFGVEPDPWQAEVLAEFPRQQRIAMKACKGPGKMLSNSTMIYTPAGRVQWGSLRPGDKVFAEDGTKTTVVQVFHHEAEPIYKITFDDGTSAECGLEHHWKVRGRTEKRRKTWSVLTTAEIIERGVVLKQGGKYPDYYQFQIPRQGKAKFPAKKLPLDPYLVGVWLGDGTRSTPNWTKNDEEIAERIKNKGYKVKCRQQRDKAAVWVVLGERDNFRKLDCFNKLACEKFIPEEYKTSSINQREELLRGLMDTDGTCDYRDGSCEFNTTSKQLAEDVAWLVRSLAGKATIKTKRSFLHGKEYNLLYRVRVTTDFNPFYLKRKAERWKAPTQERYFMRTIKSIDYIRDEDALCIEVDHPSHCYLANDFIVTHNTCLIAWLCWNFLATRKDPKIAATSITEDNLADGLWAEMAKWQVKSQYLQSEFVWTKRRIFNKREPNNWFMSARSWSKSATGDQQANTLAGLHADFIMFVLDESGGIPAAVMAAAEAALSTGIECKLVQAGNPTHLEGPLYAACTNERHLWYVVEITGDPDNPKRSPRISVKWAREQIEKYGLDNPWVLVNVFGKFPPSSMNTLLGPDEVEEAMKRTMSEADVRYMQKRLGVDVARFGDDRTVFAPRQGLVAYKMREFRNLRSNEVAGQVLLAYRNWRQELTLVDETGGYGAGVIDALIQSDFAPLGINFANKANEPTRYYNMRAEMYWEMAQWVKRGGILPNDPELKRELTAPTYTFKNGRILLESKDQLKDRLGFSPDKADALALTFALPEQPAENSLLTQLNHVNKTKSDYNPLDNL